jgi:hypothetical protein
VPISFPAISNFKVFTWRNDPEYTKEEDYLSSTKHGKGRMNDSFIIVRKERR